MREAPRRNVMESKHTEAAPDRRAEDGGLGVFAFHDVPSRCFAPRFVYF